MVRGQAVSIVNLGNLAEEAGDYDTAVANFQEAMDMQKKAGNEPAAVNAGCLLAKVWAKKGRTVDAVEMYRQSRAAVERMGLGKELAAPVAELRNQLLAMGMNGDGLELPENWCEPAGESP
ncbi:tetratricopeptide repeat protein, partial [Candidatus Fermentibacteria bacterium]|nr:tetratricopeptide repeat protein [Candidatus Fermentibacteria bacterium]